MKKRFTPTLLQYTRWTNIICAALLLLVAHETSDQHDHSLGWIIFACMYATMDGYTTTDRLSTFRAVAGTMGVIACVLLLADVTGR